MFRVSVSPPLISATIFIYLPLKLSSLSPTHKHTQAKMALIQSCLNPSTSLHSSPSVPPPTAHRILASVAKDPFSSSSSKSNFSISAVPSKHIKKKCSSFAVRSSLETVGPTATVGKVTEVTKDTFWPIVKSAGDKTVVLDMYTQWCGPCKIIAPKFEELSKKYLDVVFLKLDCNQENKPLAKELGIRVVPTFKILKDEKIVKEITGAKFDDLVAAIEGVRSS